MDLIPAYALAQVSYFLSFQAMWYFLRQPVNWVDMEDADNIQVEEYPYIVLLYPVLREPLETMRTTFTAIGKVDYPQHKFRVVAIPNQSDEITHQYLRELEREFDFLEILPIPGTDDPSWNLVWEHWEKNPQATWWHDGIRQHDKNLPPKKTRQMIYAMYHLAQELANDPNIGLENAYLNYIDADSAPQVNHFKAAAAGLQKYDVLQSTNIAGNLLQTLPASWMAMDHLNWDARLYPHMSADGNHPFWVLGKGLFFKITDLIEVGGFDPWVAIEDPDIGLRLWAQGKTLGIIEEPLIEEVPITIDRCITQRKRWVCGFYQANFNPDKLALLTPQQRFKAYLNLVPVMSLPINAIGLPLAGWALMALLQNNSQIPIWLALLSLINVAAFLATLAYFYYSAWNKIKVVLPEWYKRVYYMLRVNPIFLWIYWLIWIIPIAIGMKMWLTDGGLVWQRTQKIDANHTLVRERVAQAE